MEVNGVQNNITLDLADFQCIDKQNKTKQNKETNKSCPAFSTCFYGILILLFQ